MHTVITHRATAGAITEFREGFGYDDLDQCLDAPNRFPSSSARSASLVSTGDTYDHGHCGWRSQASDCFSVSPDVGDVVDGSAKVKDAHSTLNAIKRRRAAKAAG